MKSLEDPVERPVLAPSIEAMEDGLIRPVVIGQVPPRSARAEDPHEAVEDLAWIRRRTAGDLRLWH